MSHKLEIMIIYHQAFDLYHAVYRFIQLLTYFDKSEYVELERIRIWDYYLLFPNKIHDITLKRNEQDVKKLMQQYIPKKENPYEVIMDNRKMFERIKPYQLTALKSLASYGIIDKNYLVSNRITVISKDVLQSYLEKYEKLSVREENVIKLLVTHFYQMSLFGVDGLKNRTQLLESKYDA